MSAAEDRLSRAEGRAPFWLGDAFWDRLNRVEQQHQRAQSQHETLRRGLDALHGDQGTDLFDAWRRYCDVIAELDRTTAELEALRTRPE